MNDVFEPFSKAKLLATFDDTFNEAIQQLIQWGGVIIGEDRQSVGYSPLEHLITDVILEGIVVISHTKPPI